VRVLENRVLRRIFGARRNEVTWEWRRLHNEELSALYSSNIRVIKAKRMTWIWHVGGEGGRKGAYGILVGKPEERRSLGRCRRRWEDDIKMDF
jgi:hypothetical protein